MDTLKIFSGSLDDNLLYAVTSSALFGPAFEHIEDTEFFNSNKTIHKYKAKGIGIVAYGTNTIYAQTKEENMNIHIAGVTGELRTVYARFFGDFFYKLTGKDNKFLKQITIGHEHGKDNGKCHLQICVEFYDDYRGSFHPSQVKFSLSGVVSDATPYAAFNDTELIFMGQQTKDNYSLSRYCKKDGDFFYLFPERVVRLILGKKGEICAYKTLVANREILDIEGANEIMRKYDPRSYFCAGKNVEYMINKEMGGIYPEPVWEFPQYLKGVYPLIDSWFSEYCQGKEHLDRRKGLLLYSKQRCFGKTWFATHLLNHEHYVAIFRNTFVPDAVKGKDPKLLVLDDMGIPNAYNIEGWKALVVGQPTSIRDCYANFNWPYKLPCIITTNSLSLLSYLISSEMFNTQIKFVEIKAFMGPADKKPPQSDVVEADVSAETMELVRLDRERYLQQKEEKSNAKQMFKIFK